MAHLVAYNNVIDGISASDVDASSEDADFPAINLADWAPYTTWQSDGAVASCTVEFDLGVTTSVDTVAIYGHNLASAADAEVAFEYSTNGTDWTELVAHNPTVAQGNNVFLHRESSVTNARYWRLAFSGATIQWQARHVFFGQALEMVHGPDTDLRRPRYYRADEIRNARAIDGGMVARSSIERPYATSRIKQSYSSWTWTDGNWYPFWLHMRTGGCYWSWNSSDYADEAVIAYADGEPPPIVSQLDGIYYLLDIPVVVYF